MKLFDEEVKELQSQRNKADNIDHSVKSYCSENQKGVTFKMFVSR